MGVLSERRSMPVGRLGESAGERRRQRAIATRVLVALVASFAWLLTGFGHTASADSAPPADAVPGLRADYFDNPDLLLPITFTRTDPTIDFDYAGGGPPDTTLPVDYFSVRWSGQVRADHSETYTFTTRSDDGVRLWIDGQLLIDNWTLHGPTEDSATIDLPAGEWVDLRLEYFEYNVGATIQLSWSSPSTLAEIVPQDHLRRLDTSGSTLSASPSTAVANGGDPIALSAHVADGGDVPISGVPVYVQVQGEHDQVAGTDVDDLGWGLLGVTDASGDVTGDLTATVAEDKPLLVRAGEVVVGEISPVSFVPGPVAQLQFLLPGETAGPGVAPGKTGTPDQVVLGETQDFSLRAVDAFWNLASTASGTVNLSVTDSGASLPGSLSLSGGIANDHVTWDTAGPQTLDAVLASDALITGSVDVNVFDLEIPGLRGDYFDNFSLLPPPAATRYDPVINFVLATGSLKAGLPVDFFSSRWHGRVHAPSTGLYTFFTTSDDGVRLWVDDQLIIDNWTIHGPTEDAGSIALEAGGDYDLRLEYFEQGGDATIQLEWAPQAGAREFLAAPAISTLELSGSTITAAPSPLTADGVETATVDVQLMSATGRVFPDMDVELQVGGRENSVDGSPVADGAWTPIGTSDAEGRVSAQVASTFSEQKTLRVRAGGQILEATGSVTFRPGPAVDLIALLPGESFTQGVSPGKTGAPTAVETGSQTTLTIYAVDQYYNMAVSYYQDVELTSTDPAAFFDSPVSLLAGNVSVPITFYSAGSQTVTVTDPIDPSKEGETSVEVTEPVTLTVGDNEIVTVDDARYAMTGLVEPDDVEVPYDGTPGFAYGDDILIATVLGPDMGTFQVSRVVDVLPDSLVLETPLEHGYDGVHNNVVVQMVPHYGQVVVQSGGTITAHAWDGATGGIVALQADDLVVEAGGGISANGLGFRPNEGPGSGGYGAGGGFGGYGEDYRDQEGGSGYGSPLLPFLFGSAGGDISATPDPTYGVGGRGGGIIFLDVAGTLTSDGSVSASGQSFYYTPDGLGGGPGGGAGGSLLIQTGSLTGDGLLQANGGYSSTGFEVTTYYGAGSGGRLALSTASNAFTGSIQALGGTRGGGAGTQVLEDITSGTRRLLVDNGNRAGPPALLTDPGATEWSFDEIQLTRNGNLALLDSDDTIDLAPGTMAGDGTGELYIPESFEFTDEVVTGFGFYVPQGHSLMLPADFVVRGVEMDVEGTIAGLSNLYLASDGTRPSRVRLSATGASQGHTAGTYSFNSIDIPGGQTFELSSDAVSRSAPTVIVNSFTIGTGGHMSADGFGYQPDGERGPGAPTATFSGAGHGGFGGGDGGGPPYGDVYQPVTLGSAGIGPGGGAVHIQAGSGTVDGVLSADGLGPQGYGSGAGAGGSLWLEIDNLSGAGTIRANGGNDGHAGSGAGGRIAIYTATNTFGGSIVATTGDGQAYAGPGTVYLEDLTTGQRRLQVDNRSKDGKAAGLSDPGASVWSFDELALTRRGDLELLDPDDGFDLSGGEAVGDGTGRLIFNGALTLDQPELSGLGLQANPSATLTLPATWAMADVDVVNQGTVVGLLSLTVRGGAFDNRGLLPALSNLDLTPEGSRPSKATLSALGGTSGQPTGTYVVDQLSVQSEATLFADGDPATGMGVTLQGTQFTLEGGGTLSASGRGYQPDSDRGPGYPGPGGGGAHGGFGAGEPIGMPYGSPLQPIELGSTGGEHTFLPSVYPGSPGGGAIHLVAGTVQVDGDLTADGAGGGENGGGAGGSIWVEADQIQGSGSISADGGLGYFSYGNSFGGGGGGRIALYAGIFGFSGQMHALGGQETFGSQLRAGGPGTVVLVDTSTGETQLLIDNQGRQGPPATLTDPEPTTWTFDLVTLVREGELQLLDPDDSIIFNPDNLAGDGTGVFHVTDDLSLGLPAAVAFGFDVHPGGRLTLPQTFTFQGTRLVNLGVVDGVSDLTLAGAQVTNDGELPALARLTMSANGGVDSLLRLSAAGFSTSRPPAEYAIDTLAIEANQTLELATHPARPIGVTLDLNNATIAGHLSADGLGYGLIPDDSGPGAPTGHGGAGHGGYGGGNTSGTDVGGQAYGSAVEPTTLGSGPGGGAIRLNVAGTLLIADTGLISANGATYRGAGGSIWLTADSLQGGGQIRANGGPGTPGASCSGGSCFYYLSGAGGRIAVYARSNTFSGSIQAHAGTEFPNLPQILTPAGGPGTIYIKNTQSGSDRLTADNAGLPGRPAVLADPGPTDWVFDLIQLTRDGDLELLDTDDSIELNPLNMDGDGTAQLFLNNAQTYSAPELRGLGLFVQPGGSLALPSSFSVRGVGLTNAGQISGLVDLNLNGGRFTNLGDMPDLASIALHADGDVDSLARLDAGGSSGGRPAGTYWLGDVSVDVDQVLEAASNPDGPGNVVLLGGDFAIAGALSADGLGYPDSTNPGPGAPSTTSSGAGHGGVGGGPDGGPTYGSADEPTTLGSASGQASGAGALRIDIGGTLSVQAGGRVSAKGTSGLATPNPNFYSGGGAGGSLWITAPSVQGAGAIEAAGGAGAGSRGGGGGGRVKIEAGYVSTDLTIAAPGGPGGDYGGDGSAIVESVAFPTDVSVHVTAPAQAISGRGLQYAVTVRNQGLTLAESVILTDTLPAGVGYASDNAPVAVSQAGDVLTWSFGDLAPGARISFALAVDVSPDAELGSSLVNQLQVATTTDELDTSDNTASATSAVTTGYDFTATIQPASRSVNLGAAGSFLVHINNTGILPDTYDLSLSGLDLAWFTFASNSVALAPGATADVTLQVQTDTCTAVGDHAFQVSVTPGGAAPAQVLDAQVSLQGSVAFSGVRPAANPKLGSRDVALSWRTDAPATTTLTLYPVGQPDQTQTFSTDLGQTHSVLVPGLQRNTTYEWHVDAASNCGSGSLAARRFTVTNGIVFTQHALSVTIDRDYDQRSFVAVRNDDSVAHTVKLSVEHPYQDLIVNFVGSGSIDQAITLAPGETRNVALAIHAQDAALRDYDLTAVLTADEATDPIHDSAAIHVHVLFDNDFSLEELSTDPTTGAVSYEVVNHGSPVTDLAIRAVDPSTGLPTRVYLTPAVNHARLGTGESLSFKVYPLYGPEDVAAGTGSTGRGPGLASFTAAGIPFELQAAVGDVIQHLAAEISCGEGNQVYPVTFHDAYLTFPVSDWYCTNRPSITIPVQLPAFVNPANVKSVTLQGSFSPRTGEEEAHNAQIGLNGTLVGAFADQKPNGTYTWPVTPDALRGGALAGTVTQNITVDSQHPNPGHYSVASDFVLGVAVEQATVYICASSQAEAEAKANDLYHPQPIPTSVTVGIPLPIGDSASPDADDKVQIQVGIFDDLGDTPVDYAVKGTIDYLDIEAGLTEDFELFDDGLQAAHGDLHPDDKFYNVLWHPQAGGQVKLTVRVYVPGMEDPVVRTKYFTVQALPDLTITRVWQDEISLLHQRAQVHAEVTNLGFPVDGPVQVEFRYFTIDERTGEPVGAALHVSPLTILDGETLGTNQLVEVVDDQFSPADLGVYYVKVVVDPP